VTEDGDFSKELALAEAIAREAGALLKENFGREQEIEYKGRINLVTEMDRRAEDLIVKRLQAAYPGDDIWAEEGSGKRSGAERAWVVDPLDGTDQLRPRVSRLVGLHRVADWRAGGRGRRLQPLARRHVLRAPRRWARCCNGVRRPVKRRHARERDARDRLFLRRDHPG
jgi:hypothetical protein